MIIWDTRNQREVSRRLATAQLRKLGVAQPDAALARLQVGQRLAHLEVRPDPPPSIPEVMALTGASYAAVYRWTTGRAKFPLEDFMRVVVAKKVDMVTIRAWAATWTGTPQDAEGAVNLEPALAPRFVVTRPFHRATAPAAGDDDGGEPLD